MLVHQLHTISFTTPNIYIPLTQPNSNMLPSYIHDIKSLISNRRRYQGGARMGFPERIYTILN